MEILGLTFQYVTPLYKSFFKKSIQIFYFPHILNDIRTSACLPLLPSKSIVMSFKRTKVDVNVFPVFSSAKLYFVDNLSYQNSMPLIFIYYQKVLLSFIYLNYAYKQLNYKFSFFSCSLLLNVE